MNGKKCKKPLRIVLTPKPKVETCAGDNLKKKSAPRRRKTEKQE